ncbi:3-keto-disaccharide hydrolase [Dyadobacter crusticola]|uniref:3-keto-disaccharide hydrolase n=1 Tax=Dyadobacter crusticola TaxID=292407 RepID=UPI0004E153B0|nr:DUF1080 domain-containing protein [Dyadobacter crusticola]
MTSKNWKAFSRASLIALIAFASTTNNAEAQKKGKWETLFDGKSLKGWHSWQSDEVLPQWKIQDNAIVLTEKGGKDLVTDKEYGDFELELEWKIAEGGNSGIIYHVIEDKKYCCPYSTGPEIQVLDDVKHPDAKFGKEGNHKSGSLYDMLPPNDFKAVKPAGQWNKAKVVIKGGRGESWLNGKKVVDFPTQGSEWENLVSNSKFKTWEGFGAATKGKIALQDHGDQVSFRNIRIREL